MKAKALPKKAVTQDESFAAKKQQTMARQVAEGRRKRIDSVPRMKMGDGKHGASERKAQAQAPARPHGAAPEGAGSTPAAPTPPAPPTPKTSEEPPKTPAKKTDDKPKKDNTLLIVVLVMVGAGLVALVLLTMKKNGGKLFKPRQSADAPAAGAFLAVGWG